MRYTIIICCSLLLFSCQKEPIEPSIEGVWVWHATLGGVVDIFETPESTGRTEMVYITDSKIKFYYNDSLYQSKDYILVKAQSIRGYKTNQIHFDDGMSMSYRFVNDHLHLFEERSDTLTHVYHPY